jgi:hypothetical protein
MVERRRRAGVVDANRTGEGRVVKLGAFGLETGVAKYVREAELAEHVHARGHDELAPEQLGRLGVALEDGRRDPALRECDGERRPDQTTPHDEDFGVGGHDVTFERRLAMTLR